jgi:hypothetical protein
MATNTYVHIDLPEARDLADLTGIEADLRSAHRFAQQHLDMYRATQPRYELVDAMTTAVLVRYARAFTTGVRRPLDEEALAMLSREQRAKHDHFYAIRNKHTAHSVNAFEENQPVARYWVERVDREGITAVECIHGSIIGLSTDDLHDILDLTSSLLTFVEKRLQEEKARVLEVVRQMPIAQVLAGKRRTVPSGGSEPGKARKAGT